MSNTLYTDRSLSRGQEMLSNNKSFVLKMQTDGNLVIYRRDNNGAIWASGTNGRGGYRATMQGDGNLVIYQSNNHPIWDTRTHGRGGDKLVMQDDGNLVIYDGSRPIWASNSVTHNVISPEKRVEEERLRKAAEAQRRQANALLLQKEAKRKELAPVILYENENFGGKAQYLDEGQKDWDLNRLREIGNDKISSLKIKKGYYVEAYSNEGFKGEKKTFTKEIKNLGGFNDKISSIKVIKGKSEATVVEIFEHENFTGKSQKFSVGNFDVDFFTEVENDQMSSIKIDKDYFVKVYENADFKGNVRILEGTVPNLKGFNDLISSMEVIQGQPPLNAKNGQVLKAGESLSSGEQLISRNKKYILEMQTDGNLVLSLYSSKEPIWASGTHNTGAIKVTMQKDGNLVIYNSKNEPKWESHTDGSPIKVLTLGDEGNLVLRDNFGLGIFPINGNLRIGQKLEKGKVLVSSNGKYVLKMQNDGNLVCYFGHDEKEVIWASNTVGEGTYARISSDEDAFFVFKDTKKLLIKFNDVMAKNIEMDYFHHEKKMNTVVLGNTGRMEAFYNYLPSTSELASYFAFSEKSKNAKLSIRNETGQAISALGVVHKVNAGLGSLMFTEKLELPKGVTLKDGSSFEFPKHVNYVTGGGSGDWWSINWTQQETNERNDKEVVQYINNNSGVWREALGTTIDLSIAIARGIAMGPLRFDVGSYTGPLAAPMAGALVGNATKGFYNFKGTKGFEKQNISKGENVTIVLQKNNQIRIETNSDHSTTTSKVIFRHSLDIDETVTSKDWATINKEKEAMNAEIKDLLKKYGHTE